MLSKAKERWEKENPLLSKAEFYFQKCQGFYTGKNISLNIYLQEMVRVPLWL